MSQKFIKVKNKNEDSGAFGKYYATAVYDKKFIETEELAAFIQTQASVKKSDIKAVLDELGEALKHFFELGQKVKLDGIGIFKVGFSSIGVDKSEDCTAYPTCRSSSTESARYMDKDRHLCLCCHAGLCGPATEKSGCASSGFCLWSVRLSHVAFVARVAAFIVEGAAD